MLFLFSSHVFFWGKISLLLNMVSAGPGFVVPPSSKCGWNLVLVEKENLANREMKASRTSRNKKEREKNVWVVLSSGPWGPNSYRSLRNPLSYSRLYFSI